MSERAERSKQYAAIETQYLRGFIVRGRLENPTLTMDMFRMWLTKRQDSELLKLENQQRPFSSCRLTPEINFSIVPICLSNGGSNDTRHFLIAGSAIPNFATGFDWYSQGTIFRAGYLGSIVEIRRIRGVIFNSKEEAEQHGLELCKSWINKRH